MKLYHQIRPTLSFSIINHIYPNSQKSLSHHFLQPLTFSFSIPIPKQTKDTMAAFSNSNMSLLPQFYQIANNEVSVTDKNSMDSTSIVTDKSQNLKRKSKHCSSPNSAQSKDKREVKGKKVKNSEEKKSEEEAPTGYIHVRARRGQATDSHSLAERVRRERISERMKLLQALVPGCEKVTGKALMLDEIINYVQSLQNQVEFLSMKLASVNPMFYDFGMDLESFMVRPDQEISNLPSPLASMQECSPTTANNYQFVESSSNSCLFEQTQIPNVLPIQPQGSSRQSLWEVDELRQKIINQTGFSNNLFSFH